MIMENTWVIIASSTKAFLYNINIKKEKLLCDLLEELQHPKSRKKDTELISDRAGHYYDRVNIGAASFNQPTDPKEHEAEIFAKEIANVLEVARLSNRYENLIIIAPPHFHGLLNKYCNKNISNLISKHIEKDYTKLAEKKLHKQLETHLLNSK